MSSRLLADLASLALMGLAQEKVRSSWFAKHS
jgi:hypothetical protein